MRKIVISFLIITVSFFIYGHEIIKLDPCSGTKYHSAVITFYNAESSMYEVLKTKFNGKSYTLKNQKVFKYQNNFGDDVFIFKNGKIIIASFCPLNCEGMVSRLDKGLLNIAETIRQIKGYGRQSKENFCYTLRKNCTRWKELCDIFLVPRAYYSDSTSPKFARMYIVVIKQGGRSEYQDEGTIYLPKNVQSITSGFCGTYTNCCADSLLSIRLTVDDNATNYKIKYQGTNYFLYLKGERFKLKNGTYFFKIDKKRVYCTLCQKFAVFIDVFYSPDTENDFPKLSSENIGMAYTIKSQPISKINNMLLQLVEQ